MTIHEWTAPAGENGSPATPAHIGEEYGRAWASRLTVAVAEYRGLYELNVISPDVVSQVTTASREATVAHAPHIAEELDAMARGAAAAGAVGIDGEPLTPEDLWMLTSRTEILAHKQRPAAECSTIVHLPSLADDTADDTAGGEAVVPAPRTLQTWDWLESTSQETLVRRHRTGNGVRVVSFCEFGQPAKIGVNSRGLGVHFNILLHDRDGETGQDGRPVSGGGVPVHVIARLMLEQASTVAEAEQIARSLPVTASTVITVSSINGTEPGTGRRVPETASIEISPAGVALVSVQPGETLVHTNHFLDPELAAGERAEATSTSWNRLACLSDAIGLAAVEKGRERAEAFGRLPSAPINVTADPAKPPQDRSETKATIVLDVAGGRIEFARGSTAKVAAGGEWRVVAA